MANEAAVHVQKRDAGIAVVSLCKEPVNTLDMQMWKQLSGVLTELEEDASVRGVIFLSGVKRDVFTAGNDIKELYAGPGSITSKQRYR